MTGTGIANFLVKATGPSILVSDLRLKTKILGEFLNNIDTINTLQAKIPDNVLEGGISDLMSRRLQQLLDYSNQTEEPGNRASTNPRVFPNTAVPGEKIKENKVSLSPGLAETSNWPLVSKESGPGIKKDLFESAPLPDEDKEKGSSLQAQFQRAMQKLRVSMPTLTASNRKSPTKEVSIGMYEQERKAPPFSLSAGETSRPNSCHPMTEDEIAREINSFINGKKNMSPAENTHQVFSPGNGEKFPVQNTFNIKPGDDGQRETGILGSLAEKIGDILVEQALQHGIDIT
jgi:hypothetical protein